jgi:Protein of unknown function (DUF3293)
MAAKIARGARNIQSMTPELRESFRNARYDLLLPMRTVQLEIDLPCAPLAAWLRAGGISCAAWLTAFNPQGRQRADSMNTAAQARLESRLAGKYLLLHGTATDPAGAWPTEPSVLVAGMPRADALAIAREFAQAAFLWIEADAIPRLVEADQAAR